ncbi:MAG: MBL fold metallo-hydrolase [Halanaerobiales bacterium]
MKLKWWGHASFTITTDDGIKIITDPYGEDFPYKNIEDTADIVTVSHDHFDHNGADSVPGNPEVVESLKGYQDDNIKIKTIASYHDKSAGNERGENIIYIIESKNKSLVHLGDLGHFLSEGKLRDLKGIDILLIPVGGHFTINADEAYELVEQIEPKIVIPMHYKTDKIDLPIEGIEPFLDKFDSEKINKIEKSEIEFDQIPSDLEVYVLDYV